MTEIEWAHRLGDVLQSHPVGMPENFTVAVFVFRNEPELEMVHIGFVSEVPVGLLRKWLRVWWKASKMKKETVN